MIKNAIQTFHADLYDSSTVIGEFSGRDSVAAIIKAFESDDINYILPIATFAGTEYGNHDVIYDNYEKLQERVNKLYDGTKVLYPLVEYNDSQLWHLLNGRFATMLTKKYGFYNPCVGCHMYFHVTKLKFAMALSGRIISGERESHDGRLKVNQLHETLETYKSLIKALGGELLMPLQDCKDGETVSALIGWDWEEGKDHPKCVLSGNYRDLSGKAVYKEEELNVFLQDFIQDVGIAAGQYVMDQLDLETLTDKIKEKL